MARSYKKELEAALARNSQLEDVITKALELIQGRKLSRPSSEGFVIFKLRPLGDMTSWEKIEPFAFIPMMLASLIEIDEVAGLFSRQADCECRWNYQGLTQGHYITHYDVLQDYLRTRSKPDQL